MDFWNDTLTEKSWNIMVGLKGFDFIVIGGWAAYLWTKMHKSKDVDIVIKNFEDLDLCRRFWERGWEVWYFSQASIIHYHNRLSAQNMGLLSIFHKGSRNHIFSGIKYYFKYLGRKLPKIPNILDKNVKIL